MPYKSGKDLGYTKAEIRGIEKFLKHLYNEFGEYGLVIRTAGGEEIQVPYIRRELALEGSVDKAIQNLKEAPEAIYASFNFDGYAVTAGNGGLVGASRDTGLGAEIRDEPDKV
jgi:hypothetical protein